MTVLWPQTKTAYTPPVVPKKRTTLASAASSDPYDAILAGLPKPLTGAQTTSAANAQISPLLAALTARISAQTKASTGAISGYSNDAAQKLQGIDWGGVYQPQVEQQAAVDAAIRQSLAGAGSSDADALSKRLSVLNDPSVAAAAGALTDNGVANGNTQLAQGSAALSSLLANAASAKDLGAKLPGIQRSQGLQNISAATQAGQQALATGTEQLEGQLPAILQSLSSQNDSRSTALASARQNQVARQDALATGDAKNQTTLATAQIKASSAAEAAAAKRAQQDRTYRLQFSKTYGYDPVTNKTLPGFAVGKDGTVVKVATTKPATGPKPEYPNLTKSQVVHLRSGISAAFNGVPEQRDVNNKVVAKALPPVDYQTAIDHAIAAGYSRAGATKMANHFFAPGVRGRPAKPKSDTGFRGADLSP